MYKELFDEKHRIIKFTTHTPNSQRAIFSSEYEDNILCKKCDNKIIGKLESYVAQLFYKIPPKYKNFKKPDGLEFTQFYNLDYKKFKLFLLSLLWRASISSRDFFKNVSLGPYGDKIRMMILSDDPGPSNSYPCIITSYRRIHLPKELVAEPRKFIFSGSDKRGYAFLIGGFLYNFKIVENDDTDWVLEATINEKGEMKILHTTKELAKKLLNSYFGIKLF